MKLSPALLAFVFSAIALSVQAGVKITGSSRYQFSDENASVTISCDGMANTSKENATGTLMVKLWALEAPYEGGSLSGTLLGSYKLDGLDPGASYTKVSKKVKATMPSKRQSYVICLTVSEFTKGDYFIVSHLNFKDRTTLGPLAMFTMAGPWRWQTSREGGTVTIEVAKISHRRTAGTGTLKLAVWATRQPYRGGAISGFEIGSVKKDPLKPSFAYTNVKNTAKYSPPPPGNYFVSILLSEYDGGGYKTVAHLTSDKVSQF